MPVHVDLLVNLLRKQSNLRLMAEVQLCNVLDVPSVCTISRQCLVKTEMRPTLLYLNHLDNDISEYAVCNWNYSIKDALFELLDHTVQTRFSNAAMD